MRAIQIALLGFLVAPICCLAQSKQEIHPDTLPAATPAYAQAIVVSGGKLIYISGQIPVNRKNQVIGAGNFRMQVEQAFKNLQYVLESSGSSMNDLVKLNINIVNLDEEKLKIYREVRKRYTITVPPATTLLGVSALFNKDVWVEIEGVALKK